MSVHRITTAETATELDVAGPLFRDKLRGCWVGKNAGGTLGTPVEEAWGRDEPFDVWWYPEIQEGGLPNDDLEMQLVWLTALEQVGPRLTSRDLARYWLDHIGYNWDEYGLSKTNLRLGLQPPVSGAYNNWFVDCMGSPIRSEIWACAAPAQPRIAAKYAYEDAICDHAGGESVYGGLFNVAVQSAAFVVSDKWKLVEIGLSYVPEHSQTAKAVRAAVAAIDDGLDWKAARRRVLEATPHHVAQYSPINMGFQTIGLLAAEDFGEALSITVNCGYDTDSSGGTVGSWWGIMAGDAALPARWTDPFGDAISTNESWGGVRHLSDGSTPVPRTLPEVVDRLVRAAHTVLRDADALEDGSVIRVSEESLYADDSIRELWTRDPLTVTFPEAQFTTSVRYERTPAVSAGQPTYVITRITNPHPDPVSLTLRLTAPAGWPVPDTRQVRIDAAASHDVAWTIPVPERDRLRNSNRLFLMVKAEGYPQEPALPIVLIGSSAVRTASVPATPGKDTAALLDEVFLPERGDDPATRGGVWTELAAEGNALPAEALPGPDEVRYVQTFLHADDPVDAHLGVDSGGPVKAWLNGRELFCLDRYRAIRPSYAGAKDGYVDVRLQSGWNELLIKLVRTADAPPHACHLLFSTADEFHDGLPGIGRTRFSWDHQP
ncbi:ADP-ribosylglycohydrolase family protein [Streptomyces sp. 110]|uniref:ADP-ribosylglycohydrolase family protein n=1 Tax=Streptomyces endocoffeicus TaxID=2898945 RepID=A0ABS1Q0K5_9ACTN|nr:ADP-ribosylglycohydrolase family protein [Streptomyces endocoffeicus]MBL1118206.1 ADP-ribosylglycohydrolase family protein [Streptomyces endocoffeicus]